ncbi:hypothetical protein P167DRAFT_547015 [Morchella conica CCBAS932]|uniref:Uncharacterized protein n=1 Tax=Morchella conica CCBAS932 TaxID=1392247 RepID=A0A3N4KY63_9PEZI|nr:hypothetical protein P167DRAFT_547015 [Morchella conica CCBAS932]
MSDSTNTGQDTADVALTEQMAAGTSIVNSSGSINTIQTTSIDVPQSGNDALPFSGSGNDGRHRIRRVAPTNSIGPMLIGSHLGLGAFGDLLIPLADPRQPIQQSNPAIDTPSSDVHTLQRRMATLRRIQHAARTFVNTAPQLQHRGTSDVLSGLHESVQRWNHFDTATMVITIDSILCSVGEIMRATADIEALNSALLAMRMTGATESMPTPTQINNGVTAAAFLDAIASMATEIGVFHEPESHAYHTVVRSGGVVRVIPAHPLNVIQPVAAMGLADGSASAISATRSGLTTTSEPGIMGLSDTQLTELERLRVAMVAVLSLSVGRFPIVPPTPANSLSNLSPPPSPPPSDSSSGSSSSIPSGSRPSTPVNSIIDTDAELMGSLEGLPQMVGVLILELVVEHNWCSQVSAEIACTRAGYVELGELEGENSTEARAREAIWAQQEETLNIARDAVRAAQEDLLNEEGQDQWVGWQREYYLRAI